MPKRDVTRTPRLGKCKPGGRLFYPFPGGTLSLIREGRWLGPVELFTLRVDMEGRAVPWLYALSVFPVDAGATMNGHLANLLGLLTGPCTEHWWREVISSYVSGHDPISIMAADTYWRQQPAADRHYPKDLEGETVPAFDPMLDHAQAIMWHDHLCPYNTLTGALWDVDVLAGHLAELVLLGYVRTQPGGRLRLTPAGHMWAHQAGVRLLG